ncbi:MAG TPA: carbon storage regulator [Tepidisphaeraceae bacterium]|jgi:carbon storage regulator|nr:carbon storage regulator [Tepidisphaeraceae bacterium]
MLVLARAPQEAVMVGDEIVVEVLDLNPFEVKIRAHNSTDELFSGVLAENEHIDIGPQMQIYVVDIRAQINKVRLGIVAPKEVSVHRKEVYDAIRNPPRWR